MGCLAGLALTLTLWAGAVAPAYRVPVEVFINTRSHDEDKLEALAFARSVVKVVESSTLLVMVEPDPFAVPGTFEIHLDLRVADGKVATSWEVWVMDGLMRRQKLWRSGLSWAEVDAETLVWKGNALVTKQAIRVVQSLEQIELNLRKTMKEYHQRNTADI